MTTFVLDLESAIQRDNLWNLRGYGEILDWYRKAADRAIPKAQDGLGLLYATGGGVAQDDVQAYMWFTLAGWGGNAAAFDHLDLIAARLTPAQIEQAKALATAWKPKTGK